VGFELPQHEQQQALQEQVLTPLGEAPSLQAPGLQHRLAHSSEGSSESSRCNSPEAAVRELRNSVERQAGSTTVGVVGFELLHPLQQQGLLEHAQTQLSEQPPTFQPHVAHSIEGSSQSSSSSSNNSRRCSSPEARASKLLPAVQPEVACSTDDTPVVAVGTQHEVQAHQQEQAQEQGLQQQASESRGMSPASLAARATSRASSMHNGCSLQDCAVAAEAVSLLPTGTNSSPRVPALAVSLPCLSVATQQQQGSGVGDEVRESSTPAAKRSCAGDSCTPDTVLLAQEETGAAAGSVPIAELIVLQQQELALDWQAFESPAMAAGSSKGDSTSCSSGPSSSCSAAADVAYAGPLAQQASSNLVAGDVAGFELPQEDAQSPQGEAAVLQHSTPLAHESSSSAGSGCSSLVAVVGELPHRVQAEADNGALSAPVVGLGFPLQVDEQQQGLQQQAQIQVREEAPYLQHDVSHSDSGSSASNSPSCSPVAAQLEFLPGPQVEVESSAAVAAAAVGPCLPHQEQEQEQQHASTARFFTATSCIASDGSTMHGGSCSTPDGGCGAVQAAGSASLLLADTDSSPAVPAMDLDNQYAAIQQHHSVQQQQQALDGCAAASGGSTPADFSSSNRGSCSAAISTANSATLAQEEAPAVPGLCAPHVPLVVQELELWRQAPDGHTMAAGSSRGHITRCSSRPSSSYSVAEAADVASLERQASSSLGAAAALRFELTQQQAQALQGQQQLQHSLPQASGSSNSSSSNSSLKSASPAAQGPLLLLAGTNSLLEEPAVGVDGLRDAVQQQHALEACTPASEGSTPAAASRRSSRIGSCSSAAIAADGATLAQAVEPAVAGLTATPLPVVVQKLELWWQTSEGHAMAVGSGSSNSSSCSSAPTSSFSAAADAADASVLAQQASSGLAAADALAVELSQQQTQEPLCNQELLHSLSQASDSSGSSESSKSGSSLLALELLSQQARLRLAGTDSRPAEPAAVEDVPHDAVQQPQALEACVEASEGSAPPAASRSSSSRGGSCSLAASAADGATSASEGKAAAAGLQPTHLAVSVHGVKLWWQAAEGCARPGNSSRSSSDSHSSGTSSSCSAADADAALVATPRQPTTTSFVAMAVQVCDLEQQQVFSSAVHSSLDHSSSGSGSARASDDCAVDESEHTPAIPLVAADAVTQEELALTLQPSVGTGSPAGSSIPSPQSSAGAATGSPAAELLETGVGCTGVVTGAMDEGVAAALQVAVAIQGPCTSCPAVDMSPGLTAAPIEAAVSTTAGSVQPAECASTTLADIDAIIESLLDAVGATASPAWPGIEWAGTVQSCAAAIAETASSTQSGRISGSLGGGNFISISPVVSASAVGPLEAAQAQQGVPAPHSASPHNAVAGSSAGISSRGSDGGSSSAGESPDEEEGPSWQALLAVAPGMSSAEPEGPAAAAAPAAAVEGVGHSAAMRDSSRYEELCSRTLDSGSFKGAAPSASGEGAADEAGESRAWCAMRGDGSSMVCGTVMQHLHGVVSVFKSLLRMHTFCLVLDKKNSRCQRALSDCCTMLCCAVFVCAVLQEVRAASATAYAEVAALVEDGSWSSGCSASPSVPTTADADMGNIAVSDFGLGQQEAASAVASLQSDSSTAGGWWASGCGLATMLGVGSMSGADLVIHGFSLARTT
jgi:hypothetical protein